MVTFSGAVVLSTTGTAIFSLGTSCPFNLFSGAGMGCGGMVLIAATFAILFVGSVSLGTLVDLLVAAAAAAAAAVDVAPNPAGRGNPDLITEGGGCAGEGKTLVTLVNLLLLLFL